MEFPELFSHNPGPFWFYKVLRTFRRERIPCHHCLKRKCDRRRPPGCAALGPLPWPVPLRSAGAGSFALTELNASFPRRRQSWFRSLPRVCNRCRSPEGFHKFPPRRESAAVEAARILLSPRHHGLLLKAVNPPKGTFSRTTSVSRLFCAESLSRPLQTFVLPRPPRGCFWTGWASGAQDLSPRVRWELVFNKVILLPGTSLPPHPQARAPPPVSCPLPSAVPCLLWRTDGGPLAGSAAAPAGAGHIPAGTALCSASLLSARAGRGGRGGRGAS